MTQLSYNLFKFNFVISKDMVSFLDKKVSIDKVPNIQTTVFHKETDHQSYLHNNNEHPLCLKKSITFSKTLRLKRICSTTTELEDESVKLWNKYMELTT